MSLFDWKKCALGQKQVTQFGIVYTEEGISPDPAKVELIKQWPQPEDKSAIKNMEKHTVM